VNDALWFHRNEYHTEISFSLQSSAVEQFLDIPLRPANQQPAFEPQTRLKFDWTVNEVCNLLAITNLSGQLSLESIR